MPFIFQGLSAVLSTVLSVVVVCLAVLVYVNYVQCVKYPVSRFVCCLSLCGCGTTPPAGCCFSRKITLKAARLYPFCESTAEGTQFESIVEESSKPPECSLTYNWGQCMNRTPMNNCCCPLRVEACCFSC